MINAKLKTALRPWLAPAIISMGKSVENSLLGRGKAAPDWEYVPAGWSAAHMNSAISDWSYKTIAEHQAKHWPHAIRAIRAGDDPGPSAAAFYSGFAAALAGVAGGRSCVSVLDWGGGMGLYYQVALAYLPYLRVEYHVKDLPSITAAGQRVNPDVCFHTGDECLERRYDFVLASSSIQYSEDWQSVVRKLAGATEKHLLITRTPMVQAANSFVFVQRPDVYQTEYLAWCLRQSDVVEAVTACGLRLLREYHSGETPHIVNAPESCCYKGLLFERVPLTPADFGRQ